MDDPDLADVVLRCYTRKHTEKKWKPPKADPWIMPKKVLVFDTETTTDERLSLTFGCCKVYTDGVIERTIMFYSDLAKDHEMTFIRQHAEEKGYDLVHIDEFRDIFLLLAYDQECMVVGFNLKFDLTRIAIDVVPGRGRNHGAFSTILSKNPAYPRLIIRHIDNTKSFINFSDSFTRTRGNNKWIKRKRKKFRGNFIDLRTVVFSLTSEKLSLAKSCDHFHTRYRKMETEDHGKITSEYIEYNEADVDATYSLFLAVMKEYKRFYLDPPITKLFSPASIGKTYLSQMGVKSFDEKNPDFPSDVKGYVMSTFFGGRSEVRIRKDPVQISYMDVMSMYPTVNVLQGLWKYVIADHIDYFDDTEIVQEFLSKVDLDMLKRKDTWRELNTVCLVKPKGEIFPVRSRYGNNYAYNIGLNHLTSETPIWYALSDVVSAKLLNGEAPEILRAIRFAPRGVQPGLRKIKIIGGIEIDPLRSDFFETLIEERNKIKLRRSKIGGEVEVLRRSGSTSGNNSEPPTSELDAEFRKLTSEQYMIKIITNATSYGIFVQLNSKRSVHETKLDVFGLDEFSVSKQKVERSGPMFNPIIGTFITSASRLILAIGERILLDRDETYAFCDTDSMAVPVQSVPFIQDYFRNLNPYSFPNDVFEMEPQNFDPDTHESVPLWFYGISAKRYVLYNIVDGKRIIRKKSLHGLGHILNPFSPDIDWQEKIWQDILGCHYHPEKLSDILDGYRSRYAVTQLTISSPDILKWFVGINQGLPFDQRIKPFNFALVGTSMMVNEKTGDPITPIVPFSSNSRKAPFGPFIDYHSGDMLQGTEYWKSMDDVLFDYMNHPESKFEGDAGVLSRRHLKVGEIVYIGKELDKLDETSILGIGKNGYSVYNNKKWERDQVRKDPYSVSYRKVEEIGISRSTLKRWRKKNNIINE